MNNYLNEIDNFKKHGFMFAEPLNVFIPEAEGEIMKAGEAIGKKLIKTNLITQVAEYLSNTGGKHLLLLGSVGTGKTLLATKIIPFIFFVKYKKVYTVYKACDLFDNLEHAKKYPFVVVDDFGTESTAVNFGNKTDAFSEWIDSLEERTCLAIATTNQDANQIKQKYGIRTYDRLRGLFKVIQVNEKSMRN